MKRVELLIKQVQRATENERVGSTDGINLEEYYQYFTDAQRLIQRRVINVNDKVFRTYDTFAASGSERYDNAPYNIFAKNKIVSLEYSADGSDAKYKKLDKATQGERFSIAGEPTQYIIEGGVLIVNAYPSTGTFRRTYNYALPKLDKRRATVGSRTLSATQLTALTLSGYTADDYALDDYLTVVGWDGTIRMRGIPYTAVDSGTGVVTIQGSAYTFPTDSTAPVGDYVCLGANSSTHCQLDDQCEDFLLLYCQKRILMRDSSADAGDLVESDLNPLIADIIDLYADDADVTEVPITDFSYFQDLD